MICLTIEDKIWTFIQEMGYLNNEHVLGILFYGSFLTGFNNSQSDIDLHIIFDDSNPDHLIRGNKIIGGTRIEYFEKPIRDVYLTILEDYQTQNNASLTIFGKSYVVYAKDNEIENLQNYVLKKFQDDLPPLSLNEAMEQVSIINNRMEKLEQYARDNYPFFEHLYHLTIDKIRRFYHSLMGIPRIEVSKGFRLYKDPIYRKSFCIDKLPEQEFLDIYFRSISDTKLSATEKFDLLNRMYQFVKRNIYLSNEEYRIPIKSRNVDTIPLSYLPSSICNKANIKIPDEVLTKLNKFIEEMGYLGNEHCLGVIVYGSSLTGFNSATSDIDLHVIFDNESSTIIRGMKMVEGTKIEYFEKPIEDIYLSADNGFLNQDNAFFSMIGNGTIVFQKDKSLSDLQEYILRRFSEPMPILEENEIREQISIINNKMEKLERFAKSDDENFYHLYHLVIDKIRKFYHKRLGIPKIQTSKVYRIYTDEAYRKSMYKEAHDSEFVRMYMEAITTKNRNKLYLFRLVQNLFRYTTRGVNLSDEYRIQIKSRNTRYSKTGINKVLTRSINTD